jgi:hypothetical protein
MSKKIITTYAKLDPAIKKAIKEKYPDGVEDDLTVMKNVIKGYYFDGFVFEYEDTTYMIEWKSTVATKKIVVDDEIDELTEIPDGLEDADDDVELDEEIEEAFHEIKRKKHAFREEHALKRNRTAIQKNKSM